MSITETMLRTAQHKIQPEAYQWALDNLDYLAKPMKLLGTSIKIEKGLDAKRELYVLYLQPATKVAVKTLCPVAAAAGCEGPCLISSGMLGLSTGQRAATKRTLWFLCDREGFEAQLSREVMAKQRTADRKGHTVAFRLNGTSDIDWTGFVSRHINSEFYDYTKSLSYVRRGGRLVNYDLTYSGSMAMPEGIRKALVEGHRVAVAINSRKLPEGAYSFDDSDDRANDPKVLGWLSRKGSNKAEIAAEDRNVASFFVTGANKRVFDDIIAIGV